MIDEIRSGQLSVRILVTGEVQGVGFRHAARQHADALGLEASPINKEDGSVEIEVIGEHAAVSEFIQWSRTGPDLARVDDIVVIQRDARP